MRGRKYTDKQVQKVLDKFEELGTKAATAEATGISLTTVKKIINSPEAYMAKPLELTSAQIKSIVKLREKGTSFKKIGLKFKKSDSYIHKIYYENVETWGQND